jgi:hypothetical protein
MGRFCSGDVLIVEAPAAGTPPLHEGAPLARDFDKAKAV